MHSPANFSQLHGQQQQPPNYYQHHAVRAYEHPPHAVLNGNYHSHRARNPGTIRWNANGVSTSAERRLPFVHRFRPVGQSRPPAHPHLPPHPPAEHMSSYETNPVGALQERFQARGLLPEYKCLEVSNVANCPLFSFEVTIGDTVVRGSGQTKKQAKHASARTMLAVLDRGSDSIVGGAAENSAAGKSSDNSRPVSNQVGMLQEYCLSHGLPMPVYGVTSISGMPHKRCFAMEVKVGSISVSAEGMSKKEAKRNAAYNIHEKLQQGARVAEVEVKDAEREVSSESSGGDRKLATMTREQAMVVKSFFEGFDCGRNEGVLHSLHAGSVGRHEGSYVEVLRELGKEQNVIITYVDVEELSDEGEVQCLVQIATMPVAVCYGSGKTTGEANSKAAKAALQYLKMMTQMAPSPDGKNPKPAAVDKQEAAEKTSLQVAAI